MPPSPLHREQMDTSDDSYRLLSSAPQSASKPSTEDGTTKAKRVNKACLNCRQRKSKCHLNDDGSVPCQRCRREGLECILGGSNRGGRRIRRKTFENHSLQGRTTLSPDVSNAFGLGNVGTVASWARSESNGTSLTSPVLSRPSIHDVPREEHMVTDLHRPGTSEEESSAPLSPSAENVPFSKLQNPSDALGILAQVAENDGGENGLHHVHRLSNTQDNAHTSPLQPTSARLNYPPVDEGRLSIQQVDLLVRRYREFYHPYYPLCPPKMFDSSRIMENIAQEPVLLTAILVISSKDLTDQPVLYDICAAYMRSLVGDLAAGGEGSTTLGAVEALLLMGEWAPYTQRSKSDHVGRGEEDRESWMHVGLALRTGYFLGLDKYSFRVADDGKDPELHRKVLVWTACFVSDRSISIRIGKAFWARGPGPLTSFCRDDWPALLPPSRRDEDFASIFQATLELTLIFTNVHDVLYSSAGSSFRTHLSGGYVKFIDDFRSAIYGWKSVWGTLTCSPHIKAALLMSYDYLRLYTNAFAFQATVRRLLKTKNNPNDPTDYQALHRIFATGVAALSDVRFIYESLDAAKAILSTANNFVDPEKMLRFMPLRIYLYLVYAGVFLYRARCVGVMGPDEDGAIKKMIRETISRLQRSSVGPLHPGARYAQLLRLLWNKLVTNDKHYRIVKPSDSHHALNNNIGATPISLSSQSAPSVTGAATTPPMPEPMPDFAWTDLMAVGDFALGTGGANGTNGGAAGLNGAAASDETAFWSGFLPIDMGNQGIGWDLGMPGQFGGSLGMGF